MQKTFDDDDDIDGGDVEEDVNHYVNVGTNNDIKKTLRSKTTIIK